MNKIIIKDINTPIVLIHKKSSVNSNSNWKITNKEEEVNVRLTKAGLKIYSELKTSNNKLSSFLNKIGVSIEINVQTHKNEDCIVIECDLDKYIEIEHHSMKKLTIKGANEITVHQKTMGVVCVKETKKAKVINHSSSDTYLEKIKEIEMINKSLGKVKITGKNIDSVLCEVHSTGDIEIESETIKKANVLSRSIGSISIKSKEISELGASCQGSGDIEINSKVNSIDLLENDTIGKVKIFYK